MRGGRRGRTKVERLPIGYRAAVQRPALPCPAAGDGIRAP